MSSETVTFQLPQWLYADLQSLAKEEQTDLIEMLARLIKMAYKRHAWRRELNALREQIQQDGGLQVGDTTEEIVEHMRQTRREIFEAEYAHLYR